MAIKHQSLTFDEMIEYFQQKLNVPTDTFADVQGEAHDKSFMVAGAAKADVLESFRKAVDEAEVTGITLHEFKKRFDDIIAQTGWEYYGTRNWRAWLIYDTNLRQAYHAGRERQMANPELRKRRPYGLYRHGGSKEPREQHLAWDNKVVPLDDPWWQTHTPQNGYGCSCKKFMLSERDVKRRGLTVQNGTDMPFSGTYTYQSPTGVTYDVPNGIDPGFDYRPGGKDADKLREMLLAKAQKYDETLKNVVIADLAVPVHNAVNELDDELTEVVGTQKGSMPGSLYTAADGTQYYVKFYPNPEQARMEFAANAIYKELGVTVPELQLREMIDPSDGTKKLALASLWEEGLERLTPEQLASKSKELSKVFSSSVLLKNWDVMGLNYDNLLFKDGKLILIDAGASFKYRAQGGAKAYEANSIDEVNSFLNARLNPQAARVFGDAFKADVFLEQEGAKSLLKLSDKRVKEILQKSGLDEKTVNELAKALSERKKLLIDRYDLRGKHTYKGFGQHLKAFKKWDTSRYETKRGENGAVYSVEAEKDVLELVKMFENYVNTSIHQKGSTALVQMFRQWSSDSSEPLSGLMKKWAEDRFGVKTTYHWGELDKSLSNAQLHLKGLGIDMETAYRLLDAEYEFHQYYLKRVHGWDKFVVERGMSKDEYAATFKRGHFTFNSVASTQTKPQGNFANKGWRIRSELRTENILKTWYQGKNYMPFYKDELEYIAIGGKREAVDLSTA